MAGDAGETAGVPPRRVAAGVLVAAAALTGLWVVAALLMAGRGLDVTDEGYYLLSYRWWDSNPRNPSGVQYLYGPVLELLGWSVPGLRVFRLLTVLAAHGLLGWAFSGWLVRTSGLGVPDLWRWAVAAVVVASGGVTYGWLPLSPGYNDVALLGSLVLAALVLRLLWRAGEGRSLSAWVGLAAGPPAVAMLLAKWASAGVTLLFLVVVAVVALRALRATGWAGFLVAAVVGVVVSLGVVQLAVAPFSEVVPPIVEVNRVVAAGTNSPVALLAMYAASTVGLLGRALLLLAAVLLVLGLALVLRRGRLAGAAPYLVAAAPVVGLVLAHPSTLGLPSGGVVHLRGYAALLTALAALSVLARVAGRRTGTDRPGGACPVGQAATRRAVVVLLALLPAVQGLGTGNPLYYLAVDGFACWVALAVMALATTRGRLARALATSATVLAVVASAVVGASGLAAEPYRTDGLAAATTPIGGSGPVAGLRVSDDAAAAYGRLRDAAGPAGPGRPVLAFDELAGLVLVLDGRSVGEPWYSASDRPRSALGITAECRARGTVGDEPWVVLFDRAPTSGDREALAGCGIVLDESAGVRISGPFGPVTVYRR